MVFNSKNNRVALEPGDMIRCKSDWDGATLADILSEREASTGIMFMRKMAKRDFGS